MAFLCALLALPGCGHDASRVVSPGGVVWERLTPPGVIDPDWPDWRGDSIAFQTRVDTADRLAIAREDGSGVSIEPEGAGESDRTPRWVRGGLLLYTSHLAGSEDLWYRDLVSGLARRITGSGAEEWTPAPRPGMAGLVYVEGADPSAGRLVLVPDTASAPLQTIYVTPDAIAAGEPDWNPAGDAICFTVKGPNGSSQIWRLSMSDTLAIALTVAPSVNPPGGPRIDRSPRWSPDGASILMVSNRGGVWGVWTLSPLGEAQGLKLLAQDLPQAEIRRAAWAPDGTMILLSSDRTGDRALWRLSRLAP